MENERERGRERGRDRGREKLREQACSWEACEVKHVHGCEPRTVWVPDCNLCRSVGGRMVRINQTKARKVMAGLYSPTPELWDSTVHPLADTEGTFSVNVITVAMKGL